MAKTKELTGCVFLNQLSESRGQIAMKYLAEMYLKHHGLTAEITPRLRDSGETGALVLKDDPQEEKAV